jgi:hypothetical protein
MAFSPGANSRISRTIEDVTFINPNLVGWCGRPDLNRYSSFEPRDFHTSYGFRRLAWARSRIQLVCGLDYTFTLARSRLRCCPSSLYTFAPAVRPGRLARDCLLPVSPNLSSSAPSVSRRALNRLSPLRLPISPRPRTRAILATKRFTANEKPKRVNRAGLSALSQRGCRPCSMTLTLVAAH